jgi:hypothetical protein
MPYAGHMARRRRASAGAKIIRIPTAQKAPIINVRAPSAPSKRKGTRRRGGKSAGGSLTKDSAIAAALGGLALGFIEKTFPNMPTVPVLGKKGTVVLACLFLGKKIPYSKEIGLVAAGLAGYELGKDGRVSGDDDYVVPQVRGVAAQV